MPFKIEGRGKGTAPKTNVQETSTSKGSNAVITIVAVVVFLYFARGPNGLICKYVMPSAYTQSERAFWKALAGCDCTQGVTSDEKPDTSSKEDINSQLRIAAGLGRMNEVSSLLDRGADANSPGPGTEQVPAGGTALMLAVARNHQDVVRLLLSKGADPNQADQGGGTALIYASWKGNIEIVRMLLKHGANRNATTRDGRTPLTVARNAGHSEIATLLETYSTDEKQECAMPNKSVDTYVSPGADAR